MAGKPCCLRHSIVFPLMDKAFFSVSTWIGEDPEI